jgi:hypothetical protein
MTVQPLSLAITFNSSWSGIMPAKWRDRVRNDGGIVPMTGQNSLDHPSAGQNDVPVGNNPVVGWKN